MTREGEVVTATAQVGGQSVLLPLVKKGTTNTKPLHSSYKTTNDFKEAVRFAFNCINPQMLWQMSNRTWWRIIICYKNEWAQTTPVDNKRLASYVDKYCDQTFFSLFLTILQLYCMIKTNRFLIRVTILSGQPTVIIQDFHCYVIFLTRHYTFNAGIKHMCRYNCQYWIRMGHYYAHLICNNEIIHLL
jgi:hypothetical protein